MIPAWLLRLAPQMLAIAVVLGLIFWLVQNFKEQGRAELRPVIERLQTDLDSERAARIRNEEAIDAYLAEIESIRNRPRPSTPVRLCVPAPAASAVAASGAVDGAAPTAGSSAGQARENFVAGPDIGPALRDLAYACDVENAKLRALQDWVKNWVN